MEGKLFFTVAPDLSTCTPHLDEYQEVVGRPYTTSIYAASLQQGNTKQYRLF